MKTRLSYSRGQEVQPLGLLTGRSCPSLVEMPRLAARSATPATRLGFRCTTVAPRLQHACNTPATRLRRAAGFTLVEILVTMTLLSFIVLGLLMMFNQTQRAFRAGLAQTDVLEGGRGAMDMLVRDLEQMTPCGGADLQGVERYQYNFWTAIDGNFANPTLQYLPPPAPQRVNVIQQFYFLSRYNQDWIANYYRVVPDVQNSAVGSLYHYTATLPRYSPLIAGYALYNSRPTPSPQVMTSLGFTTNRVVDGVVHLHLRVFDTNGVPLTYYNNRMLAAVVDYVRPSATNATSARWTFSNGTQPERMDYRFWNNATPGYVEVELGILEPKVLQHYRAIDPTTAAAQNYLSNHVGEVHLFRQRIPIRNVDFSAYQ